MRMFGIVAAALLIIAGVVAFWGTVAYVAVHFIQKFW